MGIATAPALYSKLAFDVRRDLEPIALAGDVPMILVRSKGFAPATLADFIAHMKAKPGEVRFSHAGVGATSHLCAMLLLQTTSTEATLVPYRGTGPALQDLVAGNVDVICDQPVATGPHIQAGMLRTPSPRANACPPCPMCPPSRRQASPVSSLPYGTASTPREARPKPSSSASTNRCAPPWPNPPWSSASRT